MASPDPGSSARSASSHVLSADSSLVLVLKAQDGDERAREELCARYLPRLRLWARGRLPTWARDHLDTEDIVQETLVQSIRKLDGFSATHDKAFWAYTCQALRNRLHDVVRRASRRPVTGELSEEQVADDPSPLEVAVGHETLKRYEDALQRLRQMDCELIVAKVELGFDYSEIAELLGKTSVAATRVAISRALIRLAAEMGLERHG